MALEGQISQASLQASLARGHRASGDLIPWTVSQHFQDSEFAKLSGARMVRIATHPEAQRMGYGTRALELLIEHFEGRGGASSSSKLSNGVKKTSKKTKKASSSDDDEEDDDESESDEDESDDDGGRKLLLREHVAPRKELPPLLVNVKDRPAAPLHWVGVSFGMTENLMGFWHKAGFHLVYLRQTANDLTGEHTAIMLRALDTQGLVEAPRAGWLEDFTMDALRRLVSLLSFEVRGLSTGLELAMLDNLRGGLPEDRPIITARQLSFLLTKRDLERLYLYSKNLIDYHMIRDLLPTLSRLYFLRLMPPDSSRLSHLMEAILVGMGLQHKPVEVLSRDLGLPLEQVREWLHVVMCPIPGILTYAFIAIDRCWPCSTR